MDMLEFKKIKREDFPVIDKYFEMNLENIRGDRFCDYAPGTVKMWCDAYDMEYAVFNGMMYLKADYEEENGTSYLMPVGKVCDNSLIPLYEYLKTVKGATLSVIPENMLDEVAQVFGVRTERLFADRDWADYIYLKEDFCNPSGKKQHKYKNNLNRFAKEHPDFQIVPITDDICGEAIEFFKTYCKNNPSSSSVDDDEYYATLPVIEKPKEYSMSGAVLVTEGKIVGLTLGEIYGDTVIIHTEKAEKSYTGAYQTLARGYLMMMPEEVRYVNREEDMGLDGLRRSKLSYSPVRLDYKYTLYLN